MANSDKNILITPNVNAANGTFPTIRFTGQGNTPITLSVLDDNSLSFTGSAGQLFSITNSLTGTIFSVNDVSGIPSIDVADTGLVRIIPFAGNLAIGTTSSSARVTVKSASSTSNIQEWLNTSNETVAAINTAGYFSGSAFDIIPLDDISIYFDGRERRFTPKYRGVQITPLNGFRLLLTINGIIQSVDTPEYVWQSMLPRFGFFIDSDGLINFHEQVPQGSTFDARLMPGSGTTTVTRNYPFNAADILLGV
jgi:hypothetical protein